MKFENPIMNISMFTVEDVIITSTPAVPSGDTAEDVAIAAIRSDARMTATSEILSFNFVD